MKSMAKKYVFTISLLLMISLSACLKEESLNSEYEGFVPAWMDDGWEISTPEAEGMDVNLIEKLFHDFSNYQKYPTIRSLLIVRNGKLVAEAYAKQNNGKYQLQNTMSVTKSITSILTGIAIYQGLIDSTGTTLFHYLAPYFDEDQRKRTITLHQVLTMETGLNFDDNKHTSELLAGKGNSLEYVLGKDLIFEPGTSWYYGDGNPQLLSGIIQEVSGRSEAAFAKEFLFKPLGITSFRWEAHSDGLNFGAVGLWLFPRDMAKIGLLMANNGMWKGKTVVSGEWVKLSTKRQAANHDYGYYWYPLEDKVFFAEGQGGQLIWVYPGENLVVAITSDPYAKSWMLSEKYDELFSLIIQSLND